MFRQMSRANHIARKNSQNPNLNFLSAYSLEKKHHNKNIYLKYTHTHSSTHVPTHTQVQTHTNTQSNVLIYYNLHFYTHLRYSFRLLKLGIPKTLTHSHTYKHTHTHTSRQTSRHMLHRFSRPIPAADRIFQLPLLDP